MLGFAEISVSISATSRDAEPSLVRGLTVTRPTASEGAKEPLGEGAQAR